MRRQLSKWVSDRFTGSADMPGPSNCTAFTKVNARRRVSASSRRRRQKKAGGQCRGVTKGSKRLSADWSGQKNGIFHFRYLQE